MTNCDIAECTRDYYAKGYCKYHYTRVRLYGDPLAPDQRALRPSTLRERFEERVDRQASDKCWPWTSTAQKGYGCITDGKGVKIAAHRLAYEFWVGPIPAGHTIDHECHNLAYAAGTCMGGATCPHRACCNPAHLVPRLAGDNWRRGAGPAALRH